MVSEGDNTMKPKFNTHTITGCKAAIVYWKSRPTQAAKRNVERLTDRINIMTKAGQK